MNFQTFSTFRPKSACSDVTEIDTIKKPTDHLQIFTEGIILMTEKVSTYVKNDGALQRRFGIIQNLRQRRGAGRFLSHPQSMVG